MYHYTIIWSSDQIKMVEIKARGAAKAEFTTVNEHFAATNNAEFGLFHQNLFSAHSLVGLRAGLPCD